MRNSTAKAFKLFFLCPVARPNLFFLHMLYEYVLYDYPICFPLTLPIGGLRYSCTLRVEAPIMEHLAA